MENSESEQTGLIGLKGIKEREDSIILVLKDKPVEILEAIKFTMTGINTIKTNVTQGNVKYVRTAINQVVFKIKNNEDLTYFINTLGKVVDIELSGVTDFNIRLRIFIFLRNIIESIIMKKIFLNLDDGTRIDLKGISIKDINISALNLSLPIKNYSYTFLIHLIERYGLGINDVNELIGIMCDTNINIRNNENGASIRETRFWLNKIKLKRQLDIFSKSKLLIDMIKTPGNEENKIGKALKANGIPVEIELAKVVHENGKLFYYGIEVGNLQLKEKTKILDMSKEFQKTFLIESFGVIKTREGKFRIDIYFSLRLNGESVNNKSEIKFIGDYAGNYSYIGEGKDIRDLIDGTGQNFKKLRLGQNEKGGATIEICNKSGDEIRRVKAFDSMFSFYMPQNNREIIDMIKGCTKSDEEEISDWFGKKSIITPENESGKIEKKGINSLLASFGITMESHPINLSKRNDETNGKNIRVQSQGDKKEENTGEVLKNILNLFIRHNLITKIEDIGISGNEYFISINIIGRTLIIPYLRSSSIFIFPMIEFSILSEFKTISEIEEKYGKISKISKAYNMDIWERMLLTDMGFYGEDTYRECLRKDISAHLSQTHTDIKDMSGKAILKIINKILDNKYNFPTIYSVIDLLGGKSHIFRYKGSHEMLGKYITTLINLDHDNRKTIEHSIKSNNNKMNDNAEDFMEEIRIGNKIITKSDIIYWEKEETRKKLGVPFGILSKVSFLIALGGDPSKGVKINYFMGILERYKNKEL